MDWYGQNLEVLPGRWVVALDDFSSKTTDHMEAFQSLVDDAWETAVRKAVAGDERLSELRGPDAPAAPDTVLWLHADGRYSVQWPEQLSTETVLAFAEELPGYDYIWPVSIGRYASISNDPYSDLQWGLENTGQLTGDLVDPKWPGIAGADISVADAWTYAADVWGTPTNPNNVTVAVIDSGVQMDHPDLMANLDSQYAWDFAENDADPSPPEDGFQDWRDHGTHVAGIIGAVKDNAIGISGVCPGVNILALKTSNESAQLQEDAVFAAMNYTAALHTSQALNVAAVNASLSMTDSPPLREAVQSLRTAGILLVAAAGNDRSDLNDPSKSCYPASYDYDNIVAVAASTSYDELAGFSNWGIEEVDLAAPGFNILSTIPDGGYGYMTGTSMAAPMVAGAAALLRSVDPTADYLDIKDFILSTLDPMPSLEAMGRELVNNGRLNLARAVLAANGVNDPPVADDLELLFQVGEQQIAGVVSARDPESSNLTYSLWDHPRYGSLTFLSNGEFTYEPDPTFTSGYDRFTFIANDGELNSAPATVTLAVNEIGLDWHEGYIRACIDNDELGDFDFAAAVAVGADLLVVGSPGTSTLESAGINPSDHVRTFMRTADDTWIYSGSLNLAGGPNNNIGYSVAIEEYVTGDSTIVVGAPNTAMNTENDSRSIFIYDKEPSENWPDVIPSTITPLDQDADAFNLFGCSVAIDGDTIVVGAANDGNGTGAVYVFEKQPTGWDSSAYTKFTGGLQDVGFGCSVAICGDTIIIGSMGSVSDPGSAYIIEKGMGWSANAPRIQLQADTPASGDEFGFSVAIYEATAIVGAPGSSSDRGAAYVFWEDSAWSTLNQGQLLASDGAAGDRFGHAVSTDGGRAVVGAPNRDVAPNLEYVGAGYVYDRAGNDWEDYFSATPLSLHEFQLLGSIGGEEDIFGFAVGISGNTIVAGAPGYFSSPAGTGTRHLGLAYLYEANHLPAVNSITVDCDGSVPVSSRVEAFDFDGDEMTFSTVSGPPNGTLSWLDPNLGTFLYTPGPSHQDGDWFSFRATDGDGYSSVATVTFTPVPQVIAAGVSRTGSGWSADSTQWPGSVLPWAGVNEINVTFDEAIDPTSVSLDKVSVSTAGGSSVSLLSVSVAGSVLTIKLANGISLSGEETYEIEILDSVTDLDGNRLDGEMAAGTFPSGDLISGGAWRYSITTLTGDADGDGYVGADDLDLVRANWGSQVTPGDLSVGDVFPDGVISGDDLDAVRDNWGAGTPPQRGAGGRGGESPIRIETIDNPLDGYITHDLLFAVVENWLSAELKLDLTRGSLYQDRDGGDTTPHPGLLAERSTVVYDTYLSGGSANADVTVFGGAVDLGGSSEFVMTENEIDATWFSTSKTDARLLQLARLTFSGDAVGTWSMRVSDSIGAVHFVSGTILDGRLYI